MMATRPRPIPNPKSCRHLGARLDLSNQADGTQFHEYYCPECGARFQHFFYARGGRILCGNNFRPVPL